MPKARDLTGMVFGQLTVLHRVDNDRRGIRWLCACDCGKNKVIHSADLIGGNKQRVNSCGCIRSRQLAMRSTVHGRHESSLYKIWKAMRSRCSGVDPRWGGRGIRVCPGWDNFENFLRDMGERPSIHHSIDRIDNGGDYCKENCRWATRSEQGRNTRVNRTITYGGRTLTIAEWSEITGLDYDRIWRRHMQLGWDASKTLETPVRYQPKRSAYVQ